MALALDLLFHIARYENILLLLEQVQKRQKGRKKKKYLFLAFI
jgi:hypothetical protein